jgi:hypothetical protein
MNFKKTIPFLFICCFGISIASVSAQGLNINGDTILVNTQAQILLVFPTPPTSFHTVPANTQFRVWDSRAGINLIAESESDDLVTLFINEAERKHRFILKCKRGYNNEVKHYYDYSSENKLAQHIGETPVQSATEAIKPENNPPKPENNTIKKETASAASADSISEYYSLLEEGDKYVQLEKYMEAKSSYDKAHAIRPDEITPVLKLDGIKSRLSEANKALQEKDKKYLILTEEAQNKLNEKRYLDARTIYMMALDLKPGDSFVTQQLQTIKNLLAENVQKNLPKIDSVNNEKIERSQKEESDKQLTAKNNYDSAVKSADNFFNAGDYEKAKRAYIKALSYRNEDWPRLQVEKINKIVAQANADKKRMEQQRIAEERKIKTDSILVAAEVKKKYNKAITMANSSYKKNDLINAKTFYEEAKSLQPLEQLPQDRLKIIESKLNDSSVVIDLDDDYVRTIALADSLVIAKSYDSAIVNYKQATLLRPLESYPWKQIKYIQSEIAQNEKRKKEDREQQYSRAISRADQAVKDKKYDDAKSSYEEALSIHPENEYAKRRLDIISYQLEKARIEKLAQDSLKKVVVPVKKSKRKRSSK